MRNIYLLLTAIILVLIAANIHYYLNIYRQQVNFQETILKNQTENCCWEVEQHVANFMNEINYILFTDDMTEFFHDPEIQESSIRKIEVFFSKYKQLITSISLYDNNRNAYNIFKDKSNNLITDIFVSREQTGLHDREVFEGQYGEAVFVLPAFKGNSVHSNIVVKIDTGKYIQSVFANYNITQNLWQWIINNNGEIVFSNFGDNLLIADAVGFFLENWPDENMTGSQIHRLETGNGPARFISTYSPVKIFDQDFLVIFSFNTSFVLSDIISSIITIAAATFIVLILIILFFLWFVRNERKEKQRSNESEQSIKNIFESLPIGIIIKGYDGRVKMVNSTALDILKIKDQAGILGKDFSNMFFLFKNYPDEKVKHGNENTSEFVYYDADDSEVIVYKKEIPARFMKEKVFVEAFIDISPIEQARKNEYLFREAKTEFLKRISHDIRNPLNGILNLADTLESEMTPGSPGSGKPGLIRSCCEDILLVINDIMDFSGFEDAKILVEEIPFVLSEEIELALNPLKNKAHDKNIEIILSIAENIPKNIIGDPFHIKQVLINLLSNSLKYTEEGEIRLKVESGEQKSGNIQLDFTIEDTGIGISPDIMNRINKNKNGNQPGFSENFGLIKTRRLISLMKGELSIECPVLEKPKKGGPGTRVKFSIQVYSNDVSGKSLEFKHIKTYKDIRTLILANPGEKNQRVKEMFVRMGISCETTAFNDSTIDLLKSRQKDTSRNYSIIVIIDSEKSNGFSIARKLHENHLYEKYLIIIISSANKPGNFIKSRRFGADHYLIEPYDASEIFDIIQNNFLYTVIPSAKEADIKKPKPGLKILVAEDNHVNQIVAQSLFKSIGYSIDIVSNGNEAVEKVREKDYNIVFMDIRMPGKNGLDATYEIRKLGYTMPIVAMTANAGETEKTEAIEVGMNSFISKPVRIDLLKNVIIKTLSKKNRLK